jgi:hypothetical protein
MVSRNCIYSGENYLLKIVKIFLDAVNREERENTVKEIKLNHCDTIKSKATFPFQN